MSNAQHDDKNNPRINEQITNPQVRLILSTGENIGIISTKEALKKAEEAGLDLIEIAPNDSCPVCKILDFGKYKYEMQKRKADARKKQKTVEVKEIKFTSNIGENDYLVKMRAAKRFLESGNKVKFTLRFRGREMSYIDLGTEVLKRAISDLEGVGKVESEPKLEGRQMGMMMAPNK
ncbi:MAG: translation initiation factor IF-3 [Alphaproteobacteria bacterium]|nr:translation initiation factor IF-3 [Alphaproteobacteria bacterium]